MFGFRKKHRTTVKRSIFQRMFRSFVSIIILSAFVLGLSFSVKKLASVNTDELMHSIIPLLTSVGVPRSTAETAGQVAGDFAKRVFQTNISPSKTYEETIIADYAPKDEEGSSYKTSRQLVSTIVFLSDSEDAFDNLSRAITQISKLQPDAVFFLGDYTKLGELDKLSAAKKIMDNLPINYYSLPGDRDLYKTVGPENFHEIFGMPKTTVKVGQLDFVLIDNSANYTAIDDDLMSEYMTDIQNADFVLMSQPLYHPLASYGKPVMGLVQGEIVKDVKDQATQLLDAIRDSDVRAIIAGDHHSFSKNKDVVRQDLEHIVIGSVTSEKADQSKTTYGLLTVYDDGSYNMEEVAF